ncbi:MAG: hypothetical protein PHS49_04075 [Candidatus Gracilibacteria bacterium]|nr:hypothetical protein [Candidatus Gracilibacteria bacterium]
MSELEKKSGDIEIKNTQKNAPFYIIIVLLVIISVLAFLIGKNYDIIFNGGSNRSNVATNEGNIIATDIVVKVVGDKRCTECQTTQIIAQLKQAPFLAGAKFEEVDFADKGIKDLLQKNDIKTLPAFLLNTNKVSDQQFAQYLQETKGGLFSLNVGAKFDPFGEICDNKIDDNGDNLIDCADTTCSKDFQCAPKVDRPVADLYIMSYCPYGLQAQKGYLEVMSKLGKVADLNIKWVPYIMHGQKETDENVVQYCIQKEQKEKYVSYLNCFLKEEGKNAECRKEAKIDEKKLTSCVNSTKKEFSIDEKMADTSKQYPDFDIDKSEALKVGVQGSPTFVLNGIKLDKVGRNAKAYAEAICSTFKNKPKDCEQTFQDLNFDPSFGFTTGNGSKQASSGCAQ